MGDAGFIRNEQWKMIECISLTHSVEGVCEASHELGLDELALSSLE